MINTFKGIPYYNKCVNFNNSFTKEDIEIEASETSKTKLQLVVKNDVVNSCIASNVKRYIEESKIEENTIAKTKIRTEKLSSFGYSVNNVEFYPTNLFCAYVQHVSPKFAYTALKTVYQKEGYKFQLELMYDVLKILRNNAQSKDDFSFYLAEKMKVDNLMEKKNHTFKYAKVNGKTVKVEILPYEELQLTEYGKKLFEETKEINYISDAEDLIMEAQKALFELFSFGLLKCVSDVWNYRNYIYATINRYISKQKTLFVNEKESFENMVIVYREKEESEAFEEKLLTGKKKDKLFEKVSFESVLNNCISYIEKHIDKRSNKEAIVYTFKAFYIERKTQQEIADSLEVSQQMVAKYVKQIENILTQATHKEELMKIITG